jgi:hypothetical protein
MMRSTEAAGQHARPGDVLKAGMSLESSSPAKNYFERAVLPTCILSDRASLKNKRETSIRSP